MQRWRLFCIAGCLGLAALNGFCAADSPSVLFVEDGGPARPAYVSFLSGLRSALATNWPDGGINLYAENLDLPRFDSPDYRQQAQAWLRTKYQGRHLDALVAGGECASQWVIQLRDEFRPGIPVVLLSEKGSNATTISATNVIRVEPALDVDGTLELARRLCPLAKRVALVGDTVRGYAAIDQEVEARTRAFAAEHHWEMIRMNGLTLAEYRRQFAALPQDSVVLCLGISVDASGRLLNLRDTFLELAPLTRTPIFVFSDTTLGYGALGGSCLRFSLYGRATARLVVDLMRAQPGAPAPKLRDRIHQVMIDWRQLRRFGLDPKAIPAGAEVLFRPPTVWEQHRWTVIAVVSALILQTGLIGLLLVQRLYRRRAEQSLHDSEERFRLLVAATFEGILISDHGRLLDVNDRFLEMLGCSREEILDSETTGPLDHGTTGPRDPRLVSLLSDAVGETTEHELVRKDGRRVLVESRQRAGRYQDHPIRFTTVRDVTERRRQARELRARQQELAHAGRLSLLGQLASSLAHELSQPLHAILRNAAAGQLVLQQSPPPMEEISDILKAIQADDERAARVIEGMRTLIKRQELQLHPVNLAALIPEVIALVRLDAQTRNVALHWEVAPALPMVNGDAVHLQQVLLNLLLNALDAIASANPPERTVQVRVARRPPDRVRVEVIDSGPGFPSGIAADLFTPFFTTKPSGIGLGLAISRQIIEAHAGQVGAANNAAGGATFWFELPAPSTP
ncbi:MAG: ATP-binding protein [Verrucomicrobiota bacterium]